MYDTKKAAEVAARLKKARLEAGFKSKCACARFLNMNIDTYKNYERGDTMPHDAYLERLCAGLGISPEWLMEGKEAQAEPKPVVTGKHEAKPAEQVPTGSAQSLEETMPDEMLPENRTPQNLMELVNAFEDLKDDAPGYLVDGEALRSALHGDPNGDKAEVYMTMLCSHPEVVKYYSDRTHMRELYTNGTITREEYCDWSIGRREKLFLIPVKSQPEGGAACMQREEKPVLKCTSEAAAED